MANSASSLPGGNRRRVGQHGERVVDIDQFAGGFGNPLRNLFGEFSCGAGTRQRFEQGMGTRIAALVDAVAEAGKTFAQCDPLADDRLDVLVDQRSHQPRSQHARAAVLGALQGRKARDDRVVEIEPGRGGTARGEGGGVEFMLGEQHQRAADQIGRMLVVRRPRFGDLQMQRFRRRRNVEHRRHHEPQDARPDHRAAIVGTGKGARIGT